MALMDSPRWMAMPPMADAPRIAIPSQTSLAKTDFGMSSLPFFCRLSQCGFACGPAAGAVSYESPMIAVRRTVDESATAGPQHRSRGRETKVASMGLPGKGSPLQKKLCVLCVNAFDL